MRSKRTNRNQRLPMPTMSKNILIEVVEAKDTYCLGSYKTVSRKGSKYVRGQLKYKCPECGGHFTLTSGGLTKHGYKLGKELTTATNCFCGSCKKSFESPDGYDYLCPKCRNKL